MAYEMVECAWRVCVKSGYIEVEYVTGGNIIIIAHEHRYNRTDMIIQR